MRQRLLHVPLAIWLVATPAEAEFVAEPITRENAAERLFGGTDADGGIGDWYLSNGVIEAIIDEIGPQTDLPAGVTPPPKQSEAGTTGGTILDLGLVGANNDQLNHMFTLGGLSGASVVAYDSITASTTGSSATLTMTGGLAGFAPLLPSELPVVTEYVAAGNDPFLTIRTTLVNQGGTTVGVSGFLDVFPWTTRAIVPFSPQPGRGFHHALLDLANPLLAVEVMSYAAGPGNVSPTDGVMDPETGTRSQEVAYGLLGVEVRRDRDGPGGNPPVVSPVDLLVGVSSVDASALGNALAGPGLPPGGSLVYERRLYVGDRNDVASVANHMIRELAPRIGFATGTLSGDVDASDTADVAASVIVTRTGGAAIRTMVDGTPVTHFRTEPSGVFGGIVVPEGIYDLEFLAPERDPVLVSGVSVSPGEDSWVLAPRLSGLATLELQVRAPGRASRIPAKVTILGRNGTPDPRFAKDFEAVEFALGRPDRDLEPETFGGALAQGRWVQLPSGSGRVQLRPGEYEVIASRGPEYSVDRRVVRLREGTRRRLPLHIRRLVETPGALSADFHIHSARSLDSSAGPVGRVASFAAEGIEVMVATDHDFVLDYGPVIDELGLRSRITSLVGSEVTTVVPNPPVFPNAVGHANAWPLSVDRTARKDGAIEDEFVAPNFLFSRLRRAGAEVIQYNHPRAGVRGLTTIGLFNNIGCDRCENDVERTCSVDTDCPEFPEPRRCTCVGYRPERPITAAPNDLLLDDDVTGSSGVRNPDGLRNIDFDVIEVANGLDVERYLETRRDWFSLLNQAHASTPRGPVPFLAGSGVSDSHRNVVESAGYFRTYVLGAGDDPATLDPATFNASVLAGRMVATSGPYLEFSMRDADGARAGVGETLAPATRDVTLSIRVLASNWIPVEEVRVIANGRQILAFQVDGAARGRSSAGEPWDRSRRRVVRFEGETRLSLEADTWVLVEAGAELDPLPEPDPFASQIVPGLVPLAFTNPVFVDLDGDGFDPPGIEVGQRTPKKLGRARTARGARTRRHAEARHDRFPIHRLKISEEAARAAVEALGR
jgi:hypothetical protein